MPYESGLPKDWKKRASKFVEEYEALCKKYNMQVCTDDVEHQFILSLERGGFKGNIEIFNKFLNRQILQMKTFITEIT